ncbi:MAG: hypothetical protein P0S94_00840 [Simkaniaceae bacterium]|nr:hypothetical protein [Simkaniaceae bacterium]
MKKFIQSTQPEIQVIYVSCCESDYDFHVVRYARHVAGRADRVGLIYRAVAFGAYFCFSYFSYLFSLGLSEENPSPPTLILI